MLSMLDFRKNKQQDTASTDGATIIADGTQFEGNIQSAASIRIDGKIEGSIQCENKVIVGAKGQVVGNINAINITVLGWVKGDLHAKEALVLKQKARVDGNIATKMLTIETEVVFNGRCQMDDSQVIELDVAKKATVKPAKAAKTAEL